ncbi:hypothetical protein ACFQ0O_37825 [Saccharopolyspora spinosporotrichia]|uniref:hypothetical protein n=1 Tax=Saccharopolyspora erythraea TaxID=1836 RepID=UPI0001D31195|nr:hypothetical protein [Saccharopolyspora erythraea]EQD83935.1 hypothetical protein N599_22640 [Saccharopolyspora erythraea D]
MIGDQVGALLMPAELGARVQQVLSIHILAGPVIAYPDRWAVLTEPGGHDRTGALSRGPVVAARAGQRLPLPPSADARWVGGLSQPPAWQTVVSATRRAIETPQFAGM